MWSRAGRSKVWESRTGCGWDGDEQGGGSNGVWMRIRCGWGRFNRV